MPGKIHLPLTILLFSIFFVKSGMAQNQQRKLEVGLFLSSPVSFFTTVEPQKPALGLGGGALGRFGLFHDWNLELGISYLNQNFSLGPTSFFGDYDPRFVHKLRIRHFQIPLWFSFEKRFPRIGKFSLGAGYAACHTLSAQTRIFDEETPVWDEDLQSIGYYAKSFFFQPSLALRYFSDDKFFLAVEYFGYFGMLDINISRLYTPTDRILGENSINILAGILIN